MIDDVNDNESGSTGTYILPMDGKGVEWLTYLINDKLVIRKAEAVGGRPVMLIHQGVSLLTNPDVIPSMMHLMQHATSLLGLKSDRNLEPYDEAFAKELLATKRQAMFAPVVIGLFFITSKVTMVELKSTLSSLQMPAPMWRRAYPMGACREVAAFVKPVGKKGVPFDTDSGMALLSQNVAMCDRLSRSETDVRKHAQGLLNPVIAEKGCLFMNVGQWRTLFTFMLKRSGRTATKDLRALVLGMYDLLHDAFGLLFEDMPGTGDEWFPFTAGIPDEDRTVILYRDDTP